MIELRPRAYDRLEKSLDDIREELGDSPRRVDDSGCWEADCFLLSSGARPPMVLDYSGFPEHTYRIRCDAPGEPELAEAVRALVDHGDMPIVLDPLRGYDHGTFSLMHILYPEAMLPLVQL